jgi:hypothetical protein
LYLVAWTSSTLVFRQLSCARFAFMLSTISISLTTGVIDRPE